MELYTKSRRKESQYFNSRPPLARVNTKRRCPECDHSSGCMVADDRALCIRKPSDKPVRGGIGGWFHFYRFNDPPLKPAPPKPTLKPTERAGADHLDGIYATLLRKHLTLDERHRSALLERGLSDADIEHAGYRSMPTLAYADNVTRALEDFDLRGVPGFYKDNSRRRMKVYDPGILLPVRDPQLRIRGLQVRLDEGETRYKWLSSGHNPEGASPGAPVHFSRPHRMRETGETIITEGALKGDVISSFLNCGVVAVPGTSAFNEKFGEWLKSEVPELRRVVIAYDADWRTKLQVRAALEKLMKVLSRAGLRWSARTWTGDAKGYDDYLLAASIHGEVAA
jgi:hypothetical protein